MPSVRIGQGRPGLAILALRRLRRLQETDAGKWRTSELRFPPIRMRRRGKASETRLEKLGIPRPQASKGPSPQVRNNRLRKPASPPEWVLPGIGHAQPPSIAHP